MTFSKNKYNNTKFYNEEFLCVVITVFTTYTRKISILNTKYYESPFEKLRVRKNDIMIIKLSENNSN